MASARPSDFKEGGGGGNFNRIDGVITDYTFTTEHPFAAKPNDEYIYMVVDADLDGKEDTEQTVLFVGAAENFTIEDDGKTLEPVDAEDGLRKNSSVSLFINSLTTPSNGDPGFPESSLPADKINLEPIIGTRVRFVQVNDVDADGKTKMRKATKGKWKGKEFPNTHTEIGAVYALPGKVGKVKAGKAKAAVEVEEEEDGDDAARALASKTILALLKAEKSKSLLKKKLPVPVVNKIGAKHELVKAVRELVNDDDFLGSIDGVDYDADTQKLTLS